MKRESLSPDEKAEYDDLMAEAGLDASDEPRPSREIADRVVAMLTDADKAGRPWAAPMLDDATAAGCLARWKRWYKQQRQIRVVHNGAVVQKAAVTSLRRRSTEGASHYQLTFWEDMSADDLREVMEAARSRRSAERTTIGAAERLLQLLTDTGQATVRGALEAKGVTLQDFLGTLDIA